MGLAALFALIWNSDLAIYRASLELEFAEPQKFTPNLSAYFCCARMYETTILI